ncbi:MAG: glycosyltransferase family 39 protein [Anaerolineae bacterium]
MSTESRTEPISRPSRPALGALSLSRAWAFAIRHADITALVIILVAIAAILYNMTGWFIVDDEGLYLYQAWRVSLGELPYRDLLTPQLPLFLGLGGLVERLFGATPVPLRILSALLIGGAGWGFYRVFRRLMSPSLALVALAAFLAFPDVYQIARVYRPEDYMLFFISMGLWVFVIAEERKSRLWLVLSGLLFGLAILTKLFGVLALGGVVLYLLWPCAWGGRPGWTLKGAILDTLAIGAPAALLAGGVMGGLVLVIPETWTAIFGHQLMQGSQLSRWEVVRKGVEFYVTYAAQYAALLVFAIPMAIVAWRQGGRRTLLAWQLPSLIAFIFLSRELWSRHLVYLAPAFVGLFAMSLEPMLTWTKRGFLLAAIVAAIILPWIVANNVVASYSEDGTWRVAEFLKHEVGTEATFLADYAGLNYFAQRPAGYAAASLSQGAASSGQTTGARLIQEMEADGARAVVVDQSEFGKLRYLRDLKEFQAYIDQNFKPLGVFRRGPQLLQIYRRKDAPPLGPELNFDNKLTLFSGSLSTDAVASGGALDVGLRFGVRAPAPSDPDRSPLDENYIALIHLVDDQGNVWGTGDGALTNSVRKQTASWMANELNSDRMRLNVRPGTPPGHYSVVVGVYSPNQRRLNILNDTGNPVGTEFKIAELEVTPPSRAPSAEALRLSRPLDKDLGAARLVGAGQDRAAVDAGDSVHIELGWQGKAPGASVQIALASPDGKSLSTQTYPLDAAAGQTVLGQYDYLVDADTPGGDYAVTVTLVGDDGQPVGEAAEIGRLTVRPVAVSLQPPSIGHSVQATLGDRVGLAGYDLAQGSVKPGGNVELTLYWHPQGRLDRSLKVFTHVVGPDGKIIGQADAIPANGGRPTTGWRPGEYIADRYVIPLERNAAPGRYQIEVGLYDAATGERLPVKVDGATVEGGQVFLGPLDVAR